MKNFSWTMLTCAVMPLTAQAQTLPVTKIKASKIILVGDSTTAVIGGWGPSFCAYHVTSFAACELWAEATRKVAAEMRVPLIHLNAKSSASVQALGPTLANRFAQLAPPTAVAAGASRGQSLPAAGGTPATTSGQPATAQNNALTEPLGQARLSFDYTHLGREGADFFATMVTQEFALNVSDMRTLLVP